LFPSPAPALIYTLSLHDALPSSSLPLFLLGGAGFLYLQLFVLPSTPIYQANDHWWFMQDAQRMLDGKVLYRDIFQCLFRAPWSSDRKSTRLNSSHVSISYAFYCL